MFSPITGYLSLNVESVSFKILLSGTSEAMKEDKVVYDFSGLTVLVVDDDEVIGEFLERVLKRYKASVKAFTQSEQALAYFEANAKDIDIVVTDRNMPDLNGEELAKRILGIRPEVEIILCTGLAKEEVEDFSQTHGIKIFLRKPIRIDEFCRIINNLR